MRDNYPMMSQSEERNAPWNQDSLKPTKVSVCISITLSKTVEVMVDDYTSEEDIDEDGNPDIHYDFSDCDLKQAVKEQIPLPNQTTEGWTVDDYEVILDE